MIDRSWVPDACTLRTVEQPLRATEFDQFFREAIIAVHRVDVRRAILELHPDPGVAARVADLMVRETQCCSFFAFSLATTGGELTLDVTVPAEQVAVLDALIDRAMIPAR